MKPWEEILPPEDMALYRKSKYDQRKLSFGNKPALLVIDVTTPFVGSKPQSVLKAIEEYSTSCGEAGWIAIENIKKLLGASRSGEIPVVFTTGDAQAGRVSWGATKRSAPTGTPHFEQEEVAEALALESSDIVIKKIKASAFFGTPLLGCLQTMKVDTLLVTGVSTSGCVRATVVDALSYGYPCFVVEECTFDRFRLSHLVNLFDLNAKYAEVISLSEALAYLDKFRPAKKSAQL